VSTQPPGLQIKKLLFNRCRNRVHPFDKSYCIRGSSSSTNQIEDKEPPSNQSDWKEGSGRQPIILQRGKGPLQLDILQRGKRTSTNQNEEREEPPEANHIENMKAPVYKPDGEKGSPPPPLTAKFIAGKAGLDQSEWREGSAPEANHIKEKKTALFNNPIGISEKRGASIPGRKESEVPPAANHLAERKSPPCIWHFCIADRETIFQPVSREESAPLLQERIQSSN
jgi:hypothetical protein